MTGGSRGRDEADPPRGGDRPSAFEVGTAYKHAYFMFLDASGYSTVVAANPLDRAGEAFNLFHQRAVDRVTRTARSHRCERAELWQWHGDGGFFIIHDDDESIARDVALTSADTFLDLDLSHLRDEFAQIGVAGELHVRMAIHRGVFHYLGDHHQRSIHSADVNFAAHLEKAAPRDCLVISEEVHRVAGQHADRFVPVGRHEGRNVFLLSTSGNPADARRSWLTRHGPLGWSAAHVFHERPSQQTKAELVLAASRYVLDVGTALNTFSRYLTTTERPAWYRDALLEFLRRGGRYDCVLLDPESRMANDLSAQRGEDVPAKIKRSVDRLAAFRELHPAAADSLRVHFTGVHAGMHALALDPDTPDGLIMYSPYVGDALPAPARLQRGDMPHYLVTVGSGSIYASVYRVVRECAAPAVLRRVL
ncbi:hypothetical protein ND748_04980 [Frankia sp. AiPs1]|uniref:hypothetical protein n=1 Tax=Frankia sp. AiPs1 TaxID=573493 RepID=UPI002042CCC8|nr:hypothetical protein [Frankia sp. AiPs1]MCM3921031.1 hypothetical protein [Frankia sp. AiPs1]